MTAEREAMTLERELHAHVSGMQCAIDNCGISQKEWDAAAKYAMDNIGEWKRLLFEYAAHLSRAAEPVAWVQPWNGNTRPGLYESLSRATRLPTTKNTLPIYAHPPEPAVKSADEPRAVLLGQTLRERAHALRREACSAWSAVAVPCDHLDEAKCQYAAAQEKYLESVIDELADLTHPPEPARDAKVLLIKLRGCLQQINEDTGGGNYLNLSCDGMDMIDAAMAQESGDAKEGE